MGADGTPPNAELLVPDAAGWRAWLEAHHDTSAGVRLIIARKGVAAPTSLILPEAIDEALCFGWVDSVMVRGSGGGPTYLLRFTPRRPRSKWSARNAGKVLRLSAQGRMHPAGLAAVDRAKADGRWDASCGGTT